MAAKQLGYIWNKITSLSPYEYDVIHKKEVYNVWQCSKSKTNTRPYVACTKMVKIGRVVQAIMRDMLADAETQTNTPSPYGPTN